MNSAAADDITSAGNFTNANTAAGSYLYFYIYTYSHVGDLNGNNNAFTLSIAFKMTRIRLINIKFYRVENFIYLIRLS